MGYRPSMPGRYMYLIDEWEKIRRARVRDSREKMDQANYTYVAFAAPDQPTRACPEWVRCMPCDGTGDLWTEVCTACNGSGILEAATNQPI